MGMIRAFVGPNGSGKTLAGVELVVKPALLRGRRVVSTCPIFHPLASTLDSWRDIPDLEHCVLFLDEISSSFPSRGAMQLPSMLVTVMQQLRKRDVDVVWTAPNWARADVVLREVTQDVTVCKGQMGDKFKRVRGIPPIWRPWSDKAREPDGSAETWPADWPANSLFRWVTYDAQAFDEFTLHAVTNLRPIRRYWYWRPWHDAQYLYDTAEHVVLLDNVDDVGVCLVCGGNRRRPVCSCGTSDLAARAQGASAPRTHGLGGVHDDGVVHHA
jgi:hypothetical protein